MGTDTPRLDSAGLKRFEQLRLDAIATVTERFYAEHGDVYARFGAEGRAACREDLGFHLEFLRPVLEFGIVQPMVDYLRWLESVLAARGVPAGHLALSLEWLADYFAGAMERADAGIVVEALQNSKARFLEAAKAAPAIYARMPRIVPGNGAFESALLAGDRHTARALLGRFLDQGHSLVDAEMHMIQPALYTIGEKWQDNQVTVAQEHLATAIAQSLMSEVLATCEAPPPNGRSIVLACVQGNSHSVGLQMVADAFQLSGWEVQFLGADVPTSALIEHLKQCKPNLLGLSVSFAQQLQVVKNIVALLAREPVETRVPVIVGGLAINQFDRLAAQLGADSWSPDAHSAVVAGSNIARRAGMG